MRVLLKHVKVVCDKIAVLVTNQTLFKLTEKVIVKCTVISFNAGQCQARDILLIVFFDCLEKKAERVWRLGG